jgi:pyruvate/2-oxoacid:ferredoxin oxidoreductase beta subunit
MSNRGRRATAAAKRGAKTAGPSIFPTASACTTTPLMALIWPGHASHALLEATIAAVTAVKMALWARERRAVEATAASGGGDAASRGIGSTKTAAAKGAAAMHTHTRDLT